MNIKLTCLWNACPRGVRAECVLSTLARYTPQPDRMETPVESWGGGAELAVAATLL